MMNEPTYNVMNTSHDETRIFLLAVKVHIKKYTKQINLIMNEEDVNG